MAMMTSTTTELAHQYQTFYSDKLLKRARKKLVLDQFATRHPFPANKGAKTMRMFRKAAGAASNVTALTEGVALSTYSEIDLDYVEATLVQYGQLYKISDILGMTELFDTLKESIDSMGETAALHADKIVRDVIIAGVTAAGQKRYAQGLANWAALAAAAASAGKLVMTDILDGATQLRINNAPTKDGDYFIIVPPQVHRDLLNDTNFIAFSNYQNQRERARGEVGMWYGTRVVVADEPWREATGGAEGTYSASGGIYASIMTGSDAFGVPIMAGQSPYSPKIYINDKADKSDPLNQYVMAGWKSYWAAKVLNENWAVVIRSLTQFA